MARASLEELRLDYEDFLRQRGLPQWPREDARRAELIARRPATAEDVAVWVKEIHKQNGRSGQSGQEQTREKSIKSSYAEIAANGALVLITVASSLLSRQIAAQKKTYLEEGGFTERLYRTRTQRR